jgi:hypothetical protein
MQTHLERKNTLFILKSRGIFLLALSGNTFLLVSILDAKVWLSFGKASVLVVHCIFGFKDQLIKTYKYRRLVAPFDINRLLRLHFL